MKAIIYILLFLLKLELIEAREENDLECKTSLRIYRECEKNKEIHCGNLIVERYSVLLYKELNETLSKKIKSRSCQKVAKILKKYLLKLPKNEGLVYSGQPETSYLKNLVVGSCFKVTTFLSTSTRAEVAKGFIEHASTMSYALLKISSKSGVNISSWSLFPDESEVLLLPGTQLILTEKALVPEKIVRKNLADPEHPEVPLPTFVLSNTYTFREKTKKDKCP